MSFVSLEYRQSETARGEGTYRFGASGLTTEAIVLRRVASGNRNRFSGRHNEAATNPQARFLRVCVAWAYYFREKWVPVILWQETAKLVRVECVVRAPPHSRQNTHWILYHVWHAKNISQPLRDSTGFNRLYLDIGVYFPFLLDMRCTANG
jgi:hypothetical protein